MGTSGNCRAIRAIRAGGCPEAPHRRSVGCMMRKLGALLALILTLAAVYVLAVLAVLWVAMRWIG